MISHLTSLKYFVDNIEEDVCLICEDDINFKHEKFYFTYFSEYLKDIPDDFDIIQLSLITDKGVYKDFENPSIYKKKKKKLLFLKEHTL